MVYEARDLRARKMAGKIVKKYSKVYPTDVYSLEVAVLTFKQRHK